MNYLSMLRNATPSGIEALGGSPAASRADPRHPWMGRWVESPRGCGLLIWTDGSRAAVSAPQEPAWLVDLADVRVVIPKRGSTRR